MSMARVGQCRIRRPASPGDQSFALPLYSAGREPACPKPHRHTRLWNALADKQTTLPAPQPGADWLTMVATQLARDDESQS